VELSDLSESLLFGREDIPAENEERDLLPAINERIKRDARKIIEINVDTGCRKPVDFGISTSRARREGTG
jgi:hypothetical protein